ncbi:MAG: hypothetical protein GY910_28870 [bacterium]|nr:hypothetical protein [Deltaproteobacteria bacterium]MCP4909010.1 hypothetical protein [bacterium]
MPHPFFAPKHPIVIGHRGTAGTHPENTIASFAAALDQGAQVLESDVHVSRDGVPILLHDPHVDRVTEAKGLASDLDWADLRVLDAGYRVEDASGNHPDRGHGHRIPSLEETFASFPGTRFNLEIKCHDAAAIAATLDLVERFDRSARTLLAAGEDEIMRDLRAALARHAAEPAMGASLAEIVAAVTSALAPTDPTAEIRSSSGMPSGVMALQIPPDFAGRPLATTELITHAHAHGVEVHIWTINEIEEIEMLLARGADGIITDFPGRMANWLKRDERP